MCMNHLLTINFYFYRTSNFQTFLFIKYFFSLKESYTCTSCTHMSTKYFKQIIHINQIFHINTIPQFNFISSKKQIYRYVVSTWVTVQNDKKNLPVIYVYFFQFSELVSLRSSNIKNYSTQQLFFMLYMSHISNY